MRPGRRVRRASSKKDTFSLRDLQSSGSFGEIEAEVLAKRVKTKGSKWSVANFRGSQQRRSKDVSRLFMDEDDPETQGKSFWRRSTLLDIASLPVLLLPTKKPLEDEPDELTEEELGEQSLKVRECLRLARIRGRDVENKRERAYQACGTVLHPQPGAEPWKLRLQRKTGILDLRVGIQVRKIQLEEEPPYYKDVHAVVSSLKFEALIGLLILLNAICIGWDTFYDPGDRRPFILMCSEHVFTAIFLVEFFMRIFAFTTLWLCSWMNLFDAFLIWVTGVLVTWILPPMGISAQAARRLGALRILRLARLCRAIRIIPAFKELWMLVQGVIECASLLLWAMVIGGMVHFIFAVVVLELLVKSDQFKNDESMAQNFGSTTKAMFTLFQIMTLDGWAGIVRPIRERAPEAMFIFGIFMGISSIVLFNLLVAIVVQNAYDAGEQDVEAVAKMKVMAQKKLRAELTKSFRDLDEDDSGALSREEFSDCLDDYRFIRKMKILDIDLEDLPDFFDILDDGDGELDQQEFISGMMKMQGPAMSSEVFKATVLIKQQTTHFFDLHDALVVGSLSTFARTEDNFDGAHSTMNYIMQLAAEVVQKLDELGVRKIVKSTVRRIPFVHEPRVEEPTEGLANILRERNKRRREKNGPKYNIAHLVPAEAKMEKLVPETWIQKEGRTHEAKNPGKMMLLSDPELKQRLKQQRKENLEKLGPPKKNSWRP